ncbi:MAG TPA: hypothetical protein VJN96_03285 [Vicinamibacterales bacterium]|nr:hypothetical protein [Vicinamibacterales bacterium]
MTTAPNELSLYCSRCGRRVRLRLGPWQDQAGVSYRRVQPWTCPNCSTMNLAELPGRIISVVPDSPLLEG